MCCRLQLDLRELQKRGNGLFGSAEMTGSIGVVTINLARLGYRYAGDEPGLIDDLDRLMDLAYGTLEKKRIFVGDRLKRGLYPYTKRYLHDSAQPLSTIGVNGMNEMVRNFTRGGVRPDTRTTASPWPAPARPHARTPAVTIRRSPAICIILRLRPPKEPPTALPRKT